jgi:signal transduction histidine kinase
MQFASMVSHDLQQPLVLISGYLNLLRKREQDKLDAESESCIRIAVDQVEHMHNLIRAMLDFARVGHRNKPMEPANLDELFGHVLATFELEIVEHQAVLTHDPLPTVIGDRVLLTQLFQNLIGNALKFRSTQRNPAIHIGSRERARMIEISVRDNGIGIEPSKIERIFEPFQQLHSQGEYGGTGLGLAICKKIVELHGGRIWAESEPDRGTTFFFTLTSS